MHATHQTLPYFGNVWTEQISKPPSSHIRGKKSLSDSLKKKMHFDRGKKKLRIFSAENIEIQKIRPLFQLFHYINTGRSLLMLSLASKLKLKFEQMKSNSNAMGCDGDGDVDVRRCSMLCEVTHKHFFQTYEQKGLQYWGSYCMTNLMFAFECHVSSRIFNFT